MQLATVRYFGIIPSLLLLIFSAGGCNHSPGGNEGNDPFENISGYSPLPFEKNALYLHRFAVSSQENGGGRNVLDGDTSKVWKTLPGNTVGETVTLWFPSAKKVGKVRVIPAKGPDLLNIEEIELIVNDVPGLMGTPGKPVEINGTLNELTVRIAAVSGEEIRKLYDPSRGRAVSLSHSPDSGRIGLAEIQLFDLKGEELIIRPTPAYPGRVTATSFLSRTPGTFPGALFDGRSDFGWTEGSVSTGYGEALTFEFDLPVKVQKLMIWNGEIRAGKAFEHAPRVNSFRFGRGGGDAMAGIYRARDEAGAQQQMLEENLHERSFSLTVNQIFPGTENEDMSLGEIRFFDGERWFGMDPHSRYERIKSIRDSSQNNVLGSWLDKTWTQDFTWPFIQSPKPDQHFELQLRSDQSFTVRILSENSDGNGSIVFGSGYWQVTQNGKSRMELTLAGSVDSEQLQGLPNFIDNEPDSRAFLTDRVIVTRDYLLGTNLFDTLRRRPQAGLLEFIDETTGPFVRDIRYATENNFLNANVYGDCDICMLKQDAAASLKAAAKEFEQLGYRIKLFDCYRPLDVQKRMWTILDDPRYVADPNDGGSVHNRGYAVDITLVDADGAEVDMGTGFDHFGEEAHHDYDRLTDEVIALRKLLREIMEKHDFQALETEWWHYNHKNGEGARPMNHWPCSSR